MPLEEVPQTGRALVGDHGVLDRAVHLSKFFWLLSGLPAGRRRVICTANASYSRATWDVIGPFDDHLFTGDAIHSWRAEAHGFAPWFEPRAVVEHHHDGGVVCYLREFHFRGREFARARAEFEGWPRRRALAALLLSPAVPLAEVGRAGLAAARSGWLAVWLRSLPIQLLLRAAWALGEARSAATLLVRGVRRRATERAAR